MVPITFNQILSFWALLAFNFTSVLATFKVVRATCLQGRIWVPNPGLTNNLCLQCFCVNALASTSICTPMLPQFLGTCVPVSGTGTGVVQPATTVAATTTTTTPTTTTSTTPFTFPTFFPVFPTFPTFPVSFPNGNFGNPWWGNGLPNFPSQLFPGK